MIAVSAGELATLVDVGAGELFAGAAGAVALGAAAEFGAGAGEVAAFAAGAGEVAAFAAGAGEVAEFGAGAGDVAAFGAGAGDVAAFGCGAFAAGDADGTGLASSTGARLPIFARSGPNLIFPSSTGRSKR